MILKSAAFSRESLADSRQNRPQKYEKVTASRSTPNDDALTALAAFLYSIIPKEKESDADE